MTRPLRTLTFVEPKALSDLVKHEYGTYCRDTGIIAAGAGVIGLGRVLGRITASGKWTSYDPTADNGAQVAAGVLLSARVDATSADQPEALILVRGPSEVATQELNWGAGVTTANHRAAAIATLRGLGVVARDLA